MVNQIWFAFHKPKRISSSDSDSVDTDINDNGDNSDYDDSSENDSDNEDVLEEVLLVDIACQKQKQPTESDIHIWTNGIPSIHFLFFCGLNKHWSKALLIMSFVAFAIMLPFLMM